MKVSKTKNTKWVVFFVAGLLGLSGAVCMPARRNSDPKLDEIRLPDGFSIDIYASDVRNARSLCLGDKGTVFVGTRSGGQVYAVVDTDGDFHADTVYVIAKDLNMPNGVAFRDGALYVAEVDKVWRWDGIEAKLEAPGKPALVSDAFPNETHHGWKYINFGPDGKLYVPVGAPCNICERLDNPHFSTIMRMNPDGSELEVYAEGVRNSVGFDWHPETGDLWFTDNGRDWLGDDSPSDELNHAPEIGMHFGFPYCHAGTIVDPKVGDGKDCANYRPPAQNLGPHVAALGVEFYTGKMFPDAYHNKVFICEHGSWNRKDPIGYRIMTVTLDGNKAISYEPFAEGWLNGKSAWGRPVDMLQLPDGSLLVSDDAAGQIYRIRYE